MEQSKKPLWKKSMLQSLDEHSIIEFLYEIGENGDPYGYERDEEGYYQDYKELFDDLSVGAYNLLEEFSRYSSLRGVDRSYRLYDHWDDMTVALLGSTHKVLGYDSLEMDYFSMLNDYEEEWAKEEAAKRILRLTKKDMLKYYRKVMVVLTLFFDIKSAHDCLTSIVEELDERGALLKQKNEQINRLYEDLTGSNETKFDKIVREIPQRMWVE